MKNTQITYINLPTTEDNPYKKGSVKGSVSFTECLVSS